MKLKIITGTMLTLLLTGMLTLAFNIQPVRASGTIYIRADGSIDPPTANITTADNVTYTFTSNIKGNIVVERNNIVVDGVGYTIQGTRTETGIELIGKSNITIKNTEIKAFRQGIYLGSSSNSTICGNKITNNYLRGILFHSSSNNRICRNNITATDWDGIWLRQYSNYNSIYRNNITANNNNGIGISRWSEYNSIYENNIASNYLGIELGLNPVFNNNIFHNNFVNNTKHVHIHTSRTNFWDNGYPSGGNYWSDHNHPDIYSGVYQNETGRDGIGDKPYVIDGNNTDRYPLIYPYGYVPSPDVNDDGIVDILDVVIWANAFGSKPGDPNWNPLADLNQDGIIDIFDAVVIGVNFGKTW